MILNKYPQILVGSLDRYDDQASSDEIRVDLDMVVACLKAF